MCLDIRSCFLQKKILIVKWYYIDELHLSILYFVLELCNATGKYDMSFPRVVWVKVFPVIKDIPNRRVFSRTEESFSIVTYNGGERIKRRPEFFFKGYPLE